jgi:hypothetical protein
MIADAKKRTKNPVNISAFFSADKGVRRGTEA